MRKPQQRNPNDLSRSLTTLDMDATSSDTSLLAPTGSLRVVDKLMPSRPSFANLLHATRYGCTAHERA